MVSSPKKLNSVFNFSASYRSKIIRHSFIFRTQIQCQCCLCSVESTCMLNIIYSDYVNYVLGYSPKRRNTAIVIIVFFAHKKYSHSLVKLQLNHWCHMNYVTDVLATFLGLGTLQLNCCLWRVWELSDLIQNILTCVPNMNEGLTFWNDLRETN